MCGIAGIITKNTSELNTERLKKMTDIISHRGPDGEGHWISSDGQVGLGHRRLSIIDLSHEADQPMHYLGRYSIVFNGEIYNYIELKEALIQQGYSFKTESDTEVLMALYDRDKENCLQLLDGMFSFVIYDQQENTAFCARDRFGEKPFFYSYEKGKHFMFGSEMKCLWAGGITKEINNRMMFNYLAYGFLENPKDLSETFYQSCSRLEHSTFIQVNLSSLEIKLVKYYSIDWKNINQSITIPEATSQFNDLLYTSIKRRLRSDVEVGSSLSGGLDSSLVVCIINELKKGTSQKQNTFSAVFPGFKKDERKYMDYVINNANITPHFTTPNDADLINDFDKLLYHQEEPFGSASIYVQYKVMQLAKENNVTVLLDGQGADEILAGYHPFYIQFFKELKRKNYSSYKNELDAYSTLHKDSEINPSITKGWKSIVKSKFSENASKYRRYYLQFQQIKNPIFNSDFFHEFFKESFERKYSFESLNHSLYYNTMELGLQELLRYADRNSMAHSREVRLPFLNHDLVNFLFTLPAEFKIREGWTKWIMREASKSVLPNEICWRKDKIGFEPPQSNWLEEPKIRTEIERYKIQLIENKILSKDKLSNNNFNADIAWRILTTNLF